MVISDKPGLAFQKVGAHFRKSLILIRRFGRIDFEAFQGGAQVLYRLGIFNQQTNPHTAFQGWDRPLV